MRPLLVIGAGGLLLWYLNSKGYLSSLFGSTTTIPVTTPPATGGTITTTPPTQAPGFNSLASIYQRMVTDAQAPSSGLTAWQWSYSLSRVSSITTPPDPTALFAAAGIDPTLPMTASQYWSVMSPALTAQYGLSGLGSSPYFNRQHGGWAV